MWILTSASWTDEVIMTREVPVRLLAGEFIFGRQQFVNGTGLSEKKIRLLMDLFICERMIELIPTKSRANRFSVYRVVKWNLYQKIWPAEGQLMGHEERQADPPEMVESFRPADETFKKARNQDDKVERERKERKRGIRGKSRNESFESADKYRTRVDAHYAGLSKEDVHDYQVTYPLIDVEQCIRESRRWLIDNSNKRKKLLSKFLNGWLKRAQDRPTLHTPRERKIFTYEQMGLWVRNNEGTTDNFEMIGPDKWRKRVTNDTGSD